MNATETEDVLFIRMSRYEALRTIQSLASQMANGSPNVGRYEEDLIDGRDFSITVDDEEKP